MATTLQRLTNKEGIKTNYLKIPRIALKLLELDIGIMADWIERAGYGADMNQLKKIQNELNIVPTSLEKWLKLKIENEQKKTSYGSSKKKK